MKTVKFQRLYIKNFLSVGEEPIDIHFNQGFNVITGINRDENDIKNGVGKTLIIDALYFAVFGTTLRNLPKTSYIINRQTGKECEVILEFDNFSTSHELAHFVVKRTLTLKKKNATNSLTITKNGKDYTKSNINETAQYLREVLSASPEIFENCVVMRANSTVPFMMQMPSAKKSFIESIFNLSIFTDMLKEVRDDLRGAKHSYDLVNTEYSSINNNKLKYSEEISRLTLEAKEKSEKAATLIAQTKEEIANHLLEIEEIRKKLSDSPRYSEAINEQNGIKNQANTFYQQILKTKYQISAKIDTIASQIDKIEKDGTICPTCKREYDSSHREHVKELLEELRKESTEHLGKLEEAKKKELQLKQIIDQASDKLLKLQTKENEVRFLGNRINDIKKLIESKNKQIDVYKIVDNNAAIKSLQELLEKAENDLLSKKEEVTKFENEINKFSLCEHILGENGIRAYIINKLLELLNNRIAFYLNNLKSTFNFTFNECFEEEISDSNGISCVYGNCSGAEMKKIDLAISFAFIDILKYQQQIDYNVLFLDEILDSSLDTKSLEYIVSFLSEYTKENNIGLYLITHKSDVNLPDTHETIFLEKRDGFTRLLNANE